MVKTKAGCRSRRQSFFFAAFPRELLSMRNINVKIYVLYMTCRQRNVYNNRSLVFCSSFENNASNAHERTHTHTHTFN